MSVLKNPTTVMVFASVLFDETKISETVLLDRFEKTFGHSHSAYHPFCPMKEYYSKEMGEVLNLKRVFFFCHKLHSRDILIQSKKWAIELEKEFSSDKKRKVNFDVGVISLENLQLATGKNFTHRVFLADNIYSDLTLIFQNDSFTTLPWSYPDYSHPEIINIFNWNRRLLQNLLEENSNLSH
jgi:hypothetical protein